MGASGQDSFCGLDGERSFLLIGHFVKRTQKTPPGEIEKAKRLLRDSKERGAITGMDEWDELEKELFTPEEIAASDLRVALISELIKARKEKSISQKELEELSG